MLVEYLGEFLLTKWSIIRKHGVFVSFSNGKPVIPVGNH